MYAISEQQLNTLRFILEHLTVTGPSQGGLLSNAGGILDAVQRQKPKNETDKAEEEQEENK